MIIKKQKNKHLSYLYIINNYECHNVTFVQDFFYTFVSNHNFKSFWDSILGK
jgi:hypothetical protein